MKRMLIMLITFALVLSLVSCSWLTSFYVANKSDKPIVVTYRYKQYKNPKTQETICYFEESKELPRVCKEDDCRTLQPDEYRYDKDKCELEVTLAPGEAIKVAKICCTYTGPDERFAHRFDVGELTIKTPSGLIRYDGFELLKTFKKKDDTLYVLEYR